MNLLAKIRICGALALGLIIFNSCEESGDFGLGTDDVAPVQFNSENISISTSVLWLDSIRAYNLGRLLVGQHSGSDFGAMQAKGYIGLDLNENTHPTLTAEANLDSVRLNFDVNYLYDTTASNRLLNIRAYQIGEEFKDTTYITTNSLQETNTLLASGDVQIDRFDSVYYMDVDMTWANQIFEGIRNDEATFNTQENFDVFFPGFVLKHEGAVQNVFGLGIGSSFELVFYYTVPSEDGSELVNRQITMPATGRPSFHNIDIDRSATDFSVVLDQQVEYDQLSKLVVQSGAGLVTKLDLSDLERFSDQNEGAIINLAEITIGPIGDLPEGVSPPPSLFVFITDERNTLIGDGTAFRAIQQDGANVIDRNSPLQLIYDSDARTYSGSMTTFTQAYFTNAFRRNEFFLYPIDMNLTLNGFTIDLADLQIKIFFSELR